MIGARSFSRFYLAFKASTFLVVILGFASLWLSDRVGPVAGILMALTVVATWGDTRWPALSERFWRVAALAFIAWLGVSYFILHTPSLLVACHLLIFLQIQRLYTRKENRDYAWIYLIAFLQVLLGCILTVVPAFAFVMLGFLVAITWALLLYQLKQGMDEGAQAQGDVAAPQSLVERVQAFILGDAEPPAAPTTPPEVVYAHARGLITGGFVVTTTGVTLLMLATTLAIFLIAPRMDLSFFHQGAGNKTHLSGFSDDVALGELGEILLGTGKVMRVRMSGPLVDASASFPLYWRGTALDHFDGVRWTLSHDERQTFTGRGSMLNPRTPPVANVIQDITLEPLDTDVVFALSRALAFELDARAIYRTVTGGYHIERSRARLNYRVYSWIGQPDPELLRAAGDVYPEAMEEVYLQLPERLSPKVAELAAKVVEGRETSYDEAMAIEAWLRSDFQYTLTPDSRGDAPLEDFLFRTRAGHCEYFASAMVVLLRTRGIPSRLVNGFAGGVFNDFGGYWVVAQKDAHSWVEVFFPKEGWVRFDPTPASVTQGFGGTEGAFALYLDYLESLWYFYVLDFGLQVQLDFVKDLFNAWGLSPSGDGRDPIKAPSAEEARAFTLSRGLLRAAGAIALLAIAAFFGVRLRRGMSEREAQRAPFRGPADRVARYLKGRRRLERSLARLGLDRALSETWSERARRAGQLDPALGAALHVVEGDFNHLRFGGMAVTAAHLERLEAAVVTVRRWRAPRDASTKPLTSGV